MAVTHLGQLQPVRVVVRREDDLSRSRPASSHRLLTQASDAQDLASHGQFTRHGNGRVEGVVQGQRQQRAGHGDTGRGACFESLLATESEQETRVNQ